jgi:hypothetical protein
MTFARRQTKSILVVIWTFIQRGAAATRRRAAARTRRTRREELRATAVLVHVLGTLYDCNEIGPTIGRNSYRLLQQPRQKQAATGKYTCMYTPVQSLCILHSLSLDRLHCNSVVVSPAARCRRPVLVVAVEEVARRLGGGQICGGGGGRIRADARVGHGLAIVDQQRQVLHVG